VSEDKFIEAIRRQKEAGKIHINSLEVDDVIVAETLHSRYVIKIAELSDTYHRLEVSSNNKKYPGPYTETRLSGTTLAPGTSTICPEHLAIGGSLELVIVLDAERVKVLTTSEVKRIAVNGVQILPVVEAQA
jgi:hypothetical protein